jgi:DNA-binding Lrp family transcriptional regulator
VARRKQVDNTQALVLIKAELGMAKQVAEAAAELAAVQWAAVVTGPYDVIAAIQVEDNLALGNLVVDDIQKITGVKDPSTLVITEAYYGGGIALRGNEMFP